MSISKRIWTAARQQVLGRLGLDFKKAARTPQSRAYDELDEFLAQSPEPRPPHDTPRIPHDPIPHAPPQEPRPRAEAAPPRQTPRHPLEKEYGVLGVPVGSDLETVRSRWRKLVRETHPDHFADDPVAQAAAAERLRLVNEAYFHIRGHLSPR